MGRLALEELPIVATDGSWIELHFNRPVYPPSAVPSAFELKPRDEHASIGLAQVRILRRDGQGGIGSVLRLHPAKPLPRGTYELYFPPGRCVRDYRREPATIPRLPAFRGAWRSLGWYYWPVEVSRGRPPAIVEEPFLQHRPALAADSVDLVKGLPDDVEGALTWGPEGLHMPDLGFRDFRSLGELDPPETTRDLQPAATREIAKGKRIRLPRSVWDFDRVRIPRGQTYEVLDANRHLRIRVAGRLEIAGDLVFRVTGPTSADEVPELRGPMSGDPRPAWHGVPGHVEIEVGGVARITGRILRQNGHSEPVRAGVPGYLWARGPFLGDWSRSALQPWKKPFLSPAGQSAEGRQPPLLPGIWWAVSSWYRLEKPTAFAGIVDIVGGDPGIGVLVQGIEGPPGRTRHAWQKPEILSSLGALAAVRFAVRVRGDQATDDVLLRELRLR
jgi:hypothetical protein